MSDVEQKLCDRCCGYIERNESPRSGFCLGCNVQRLRWWHYWDWTLFHGLAETFPEYRVRNRLGRWAKRTKVPIAVVMQEGKDWDRD